MQAEKNKRKTLIISWGLVAICFGTIFFMSSRTGEESANESNSLLAFLINIFGDNFLTDFIVRKSAHFLEYVGTAILMNNAMFLTKRKKCYFLSIAFVSLYAITDEFHQLFVAGRSCEVRDWAIDTVGAIVGTIAYIIIVKIVENIKGKKRKIK